jgi:hypothetical protein
MKVARSGGVPLVTMVQPAHFRDREDPSHGGRLDRSGLRGVLLQCQMRATSMIVIDETLKVSAPRFKNLYAKIDFIGTGTQMKYPCEDLHSAALRIIDAYGPERCVWASCFPNELWTPKITYQENLRIFQEALPLSQKARDWMLGGTAHKLWFPDLKI